MVKEEEINGKIYYQCEECKIYYETREIKQKCENFCRKNHDCNTEIIKLAVKPNKEKK